MDEKNIGAIGFTLGLVIGGPIWIIMGYLFEIGYDVSLGSGVAPGILIGTICGLGLIKNWFGGRSSFVVPFGMGWGTLVGAGSGLLTAWSLNESYLTFFSAGSLSGLISGVLIGFFLWISVKND